MLKVIRSNASRANRALVEVKRKNGEDNLAWLQRVMPPEAETCILLLGGTSTVSKRLRHAQAYARHDMLPSYWSHAVLLGRRGRSLASTPVHEISLEPASGFGFPPPDNAVQHGTLRPYADTAQWSNICLLTAPISFAQISSALDRFRYQRNVLDCVELLAHWLAYVWGVSDGGSPLTQGVGIPSAAMLDVVFGAAGFDLTPGLESRACCPEAIWQAAKWWSEYYEKQKRPALSGAFTVPHEA